MTYPTWAQVEDWARTQIERSRDAMETVDPDDVRRAQARIRAMRDLLDLPNTLANAPDQRIGDDVPYI